MRYSKLLSVISLKKYFYNFLGLLIIIALNNCSQPQKKAAKSIVIDSVYNAGQLKPNDTLLKHTFYIKNIGSANMHIDSVATSCDCITINWQKSPILPGKTGFINIAIKLNSGSKGKRVKYIMARTNSVTPISVFQIFFIQ